MSDVVAAAADLLLGGHCVGCGLPGRPLCDSCWAALPTEAFPALPDPVPEGLAPAWAAAEYGGVARAMVLGLKERRMLGLARPLGHLLATAAAGHAVGPVVLVPVPSRPATVRARGHDPTYDVTVRAARLLQRLGADASALRLLAVRPGVVDQAGLGAGDRAANLAGAMACPSPRLRRLAALRGRARVVVCDDVLTTGSTAREAQRALEAVGLEVSGIAVVAATQRRTPRRA